MQKITPTEYQSLIKSCQVIEKDAYGEKVLLNPEGMYIKIFRRKRFLTSALVYPYAQRFKRNAAKLHARKIPTVSVYKCAHCPEPARDLVWYKPVEGQTLREYCTHQNPGLIMEDLGAFVAHLHKAGVLFRSLHWGNIIVQPDSSFALIDIADMRWSKRPLNSSQRQRNFRHFLRYKCDQEQFSAHIRKFCAGYAATSGIGAQTCQEWGEQVIHL